MNIHDTFCQKSCRKLPLSWMEVGTEKLPIFWAGSTKCTTVVSRCFHKISKEILLRLLTLRGFPGSASGKESACQSRRHMRCRFDSWVEKTPGGGNGKSFQYSSLENSMERGAWWATVNGVTQSWTWLRRLSTHSFLYWEWYKQMFCLSFPGAYFYKEMCSLAHSAGTLVSRVPENQPA